MAKVESYVVIDNEGNQLGGPYLWNGEDAWSPPEKGKLIKSYDWGLQYPDKVAESLPPHEEV